MKCKRFGLVLVLVVAIACLASFSCIKGGGGDGDDNDDSAKPNFVQSGSGTAKLYTPSESNATSITYYSYVKNIGGKRQDQHDHRRRQAKPPPRSST